MINVNETPTELHIGTGAELTAILEEIWRKVQQPAQLPHNRTVRGPHTHKIPAANGSLPSCPTMSILPRGRSTWWKSCTNPYSDIQLLTNWD